MIQNLNYLRSVPIEEARKATGKEVMTAISLFTGCGGFDVGLAKAGFETRVMVEWDKGCCETLCHNFHWEHLQKRQRRGERDGKVCDAGPCWLTKEEMKKHIDWYHDREPVILEGDIKRFSTFQILKAAGLQVGEATVVCGGPPCQGFSAAGRRMIDDPRNALYKEFVRVVREALPTTLLMENVPGLVSMAKGAVIKQICEDFAKCGYNIAWDILNAADYGVPQHRRRVFIVGRRVDVAVLKPETGRMEIHLGGALGEIQHPEFFIKKMAKQERKAKRDAARTKQEVAFAA